MQLPTAKPRARTVTCIFHCDCGRHFASLASFDAHRQGSVRTGARHCVSPETVKGLVAKSEDGRCDIASASGVTVWQTREAAEADGWK